MIAWKSGLSSIFLVYGVEADFWLCHHFSTGTTEEISGPFVKVKRRENIGAQTGPNGPHTQTLLQSFIKVLCHSRVGLPSFRMKILQNEDLFRAHYVKLIMQTANV